VSYLRRVWAVVVKDLATEVRTKEIVSAMLVHGVLAVLVFSFSLNLRGTLARAAAPGLFWATVAFAGTLGLSRSLAREGESGSLEGLLLAPGDRSAIFFGKAIGCLILMSLVELALALVLAVLLDVPLLRPGLAVVAALGSVGYATVGTLLATLAARTRAREVMLPVLLLPLAIPVLLPAVRLTEALLAGVSLSAAGGWLGLLVAYDLVMIAVSMLVFGYVVEE
jgi:heme exporter protein B